MSHAIHEVGKIFNTVVHSRIGQVVIAAAAIYFSGGLAAGAFADAGAAAEAAGAAGAASDAGLAAAADASAAGGLAGAADAGLAGAASDAGLASAADASAVGGASGAAGDALAPGLVPDAGAASDAGLASSADASGQGIINSAAPGSTPLDSTASIAPTGSPATPGAAPTAPGATPASGLPTATPSATPNYAPVSNAAPGLPGTSSTALNGAQQSWMQSLSPGAQRILAGVAQGGAVGGLNIIAQHNALEANVAAEQRARADVIRRGQVSATPAGAFTRHSAFVPSPTGIINSAVGGG